MQVNYVPTAENPADLFTKILGRQVFEKHRATVLNTNAAKLHPGGQVEDEGSSAEREIHPASDGTNSDHQSGKEVTFNSGE